MPAIRFTEEARLSRFGGLPLLQHLFDAVSLRRRLEDAIPDGDNKAFTHGGVLVLLVTMLMLGFRRLSDVRWLRGDVLVARLLGWRQLPSVATLSRSLSLMTPSSVEQLRSVSRGLALQMLREHAPAAVTVDFDGVVQSTKGHAEGTAVGFNKKKRGARSYWPLFATVDVPGLFLDVLHRPGNVHDSNGAEPFMRSCLQAVRNALPEAQLSSRMDAAFFDHELLALFDSLHVGVTCSVPFARFPALKECVEQCTIWQTADGQPATGTSQWAYAECLFSPKSWREANRNFRFILVRQRKPVQRKGPLQLDLFKPQDEEFDFTVVVTNDWRNSMGSIVEFHHGRGSQEKLFGDAQQDAALGHIATATLTGNQAFTLASMMAHNLSRELQRYAPKDSTRGSAMRRLKTLRRRWLELPAKLTFPQRRPLLTIHTSPTVGAEIAATIDAIVRRAA
jgi:hypothetical protein